MKGHQHFVLLLNAELTRRRQSNSRYSIRALANFLQVDQSTLSKVLKGRVRFARDTAQRCLDKLGVDPQRQHEILEDWESPRNFIFGRRDDGARFVELPSDPTTLREFDDLVAHFFEQVQLLCERRGESAQRIALEVSRTSSKQHPPR